MAGIPSASRTASTQIPMPPAVITDGSRAWALRAVQVSAVSDGGDVPFPQRMAVRQTPARRYVPRGLRSHALSSMHRSSQGR